MLLKYQHTREQSAELLRQAVPAMSRQQAPFEPISYALWYQYYTRTNKPLNREIDALLQSGQALDETNTEALFKRHIYPYDLVSIREAQSELVALVSEVMGQTRAAEGQVTDYGDALRGHACQLESDQTLSGVQATVKAMLNDTQHIQIVIGALENELQQSAAEVERLQEALQEARREANTDPLTSLANRRAFEEALHEALAKASRSNVPVSLVLLDLDGFKILNDRFGHLLGDKVLSILGDLLRNMIEPGQIAARYGGEEFALILPGKDETEALALAERIRHTLANAHIRRVNSSEPIGQVTLSAGVAEFCAGEDEGSLLARADGALYSAKQSGRNRTAGATSCTWSTTQAENGQISIGSLPS
jgi:diguanylate cyclase